MKKLLCVLLALVMLAGLGVGAGAIDYEDPTTWPLLILNRPVELDFFGYAEAGLTDDSDTYPAYMSFYRFIPAESGSYFFEILGPSYSLRLVYVRNYDNTSIWDESNDFPGTGKVTYLEGGVVYLVVAQAINKISGSTDTFQIVARRVEQKWYQTLPSFLQFLLCWFAFGWIWMR